MSQHENQPEKILTEEDAEAFYDFVNREDEFGQDESEDEDNIRYRLELYTRLGDSAAEVLSHCSHKYLDLRGIRYLTENDVRHLARASSCALWLGIDELPEAIAVALGRQRGGELRLKRITTLSPEAARGLGLQEGVLALNKLIMLSDEAARGLGQHEGGLELDGLTELSDAAARALARSKGDLSLRGLTTLSDEAAEALGQVEGRLQLDGLTELSDAAARALARSKGDLSLRGLTTLSDEAARGLGQHEGGLELEGLTTLSEKGARALLKNKGVLRVAQNIADSLPEELQREWREAQMKYDDIIDILESW